MARSSKKKPRQRWTQVQSPAFYRFGQAVMNLFFRWWVVCYRFGGAANVPASGGAFLIANHTSAMDPLILGTSVPHRMLRGPGKVELFNNRVFAYLIRKIGIFPLRAGESDAAAVRTMVDLYRHGGVVVVYPEGGRSETGDMQPFNPGFTRLVIKLKAPIIPAGIAGAGELLPMHHRIPRRRRPIVVMLGELFELSEFYGRDLTPELLDEASAILFGRVAVLVSEAQREHERLLRTC